MSEECSPKPYFVMSEECEWYPQWSDLGSIPNTATGLGKNVSLDERLFLALRLSPITLQEYIPGTNIRTYVIGNSIYSAEIRSNFLDFREDPIAKLIPIELPEAIKQQCQAIAKALMLEWTAIDWRLKPTGEYIFLEANPSPMFLHFEQQTGFGITPRLVKLLLNCS